MFPRSSCLNVLCMVSIATRLCVTTSIIFVTSFVFMPLRTDDGSKKCVYVCVYVCYGDLTQLFLHILRLCFCLFYMLTWYSYYIESFPLVVIISWFSSSLLCQQLYVNVFVTCHAVVRQG